MDSTTTNNRFKVIIVGGSIAGLGLAHMLSKANIDFVLLEGAAEMCPTIGASIAIAPAGFRILDQLNSADDIMDYGVSIDKVTQRQGWDMKTRMTTRASSLNTQRHGYPVIFLPRQRVLQAQYDNMPKHETSKMHAGKRVESVEHHDDGVTVRCTDGSEYSGSMVVGCDGIHSKVRQELIRIGHDEQPDKIPSVKEFEDKTWAEYKCIFGMSKGTPGIPQEDDGTLQFSFFRGFSYLCATGKHGERYWFIFAKMDKRWFGRDVPRFTDEDMHKFAEGHFDDHITPELKFKDLWDSRFAAVMTSLEERVFDIWKYGRMACVGDSIHKMTPNSGQGGNAALETAAVLANYLNKMVNVDKISNPSTEQLMEYLNGWENTRKARVNAVWSMSHHGTRMHALDGKVNELVSRYVIPIVASAPGGHLIVYQSGALSLDYVPQPKRAEEAWWPWKAIPQESAGKAKFFLLFALLGAIALWKGQQRAVYLEPAHVQVGLEDAESTFTQNITATAPWQGFYRSAWDFVHWDFVHNSGAESKAAVLVAFMAAKIPFFTVLMVESCRNANNLKLASFTTILGLVGQSVGPAVLGSIWFFLSMSQHTTYRASLLELRTVPRNYVMALLPTLFLTHVLPFVGMLTASDDGTQQLLRTLFQWSPLTSAIVHRVLSTLTKGSDEDIFELRDLPYLRFTYGFAAFFSAVFHMSAAPYFLKFGQLLSNASAIEYQYFIFSAALLTWVVFKFGDLIKLGMLRMGMLQVLGMVVTGAAVFGPGATLAAFWGWREEILAKGVKGATKKA